MAYTLANAVMNSDDAWAKEMKPKLQLFEFENDGASLAHTLSLHDWREWLPLAVPPFEYCLLEFNPGAYMQALHGKPYINGRKYDTSDLLMRIGLFVHQHPTLGRFATVLQGHSSFSGAVPAPYAISWDVPEARETAEGYKDWQTMAWGPDYIEKFGLPPYPYVGLFTDYYKKHGITPENLLFMAEETMGQTRVTLAALALLNVQRETLHVPASYRDGRTILRNRTVPRYRPSLVVIRPDAIRRVYDRSADAEPTGIRKREHEVRQHFRTLADGRRVRVRAHQRGDASLGRVEKRYIVEHSPEVIMPIEQPPVLD